MAARIWHEPPADTCSVVSASHSHPISIKFIIPDFPLFFMRFPVGHSTHYTFFAFFCVTHIEHVDFILGFG